MKNCPVRIIIILTIVVLLLGAPTTLAQTSTPAAFEPFSSTTAAEPAPTSSGPVFVPTSPPSSVEPDAPLSPPPSSPNAGENVVNGLQWFGFYLGLPSNDIRVIAANLIRIFLGLVGIILLVNILLGGLLLMTSGSDDEKSGAAKRTLLNSFIGLAIILMSYSIVNFVIQTLVSATTTTTAPL